MLDIFITEKEQIDPQNVPSKKSLAVVSFNIAVLDKYKHDSAYKITLNNNVGTLECRSQTSSWDLQIDVGDEHVSTFLYLLCPLPSSEINHFMQHNIYPVELSLTAHNRWRLSVP